MPDSGFTNRLRLIIGNKTVSAFARNVGLSESLIRKYLKGSDPSLSKAQQIASSAGCSLNWLANGEGSPLNEELFEQALDITASLNTNKGELTEQDKEFLKQFLDIYKHLELTSINPSKAKSPVSSDLNNLFKDL